MEIRRKPPRPPAQQPQQPRTGQAKPAMLRLPDPFNPDPIDKLVELFQAVVRARTDPEAEAAASRAINGGGKRGPTDAGNQRPGMFAGGDPMAALDSGSGANARQEGGGLEMIETLVEKLREDLKRSQNELAAMKRAEAKRRAEESKAQALQQVAQKP